MTTQIKKTVISIALGVVLAIILSVTLQTRTDEKEEVKPVSQGISKDVNASSKDLSQTFREGLIAEFQRLNFAPVVAAFIVGLIVYLLAKALIK